MRLVSVLRRLKESRALKAHFLFYIAYCLQRAHLCLAVVKYIDNYRGVCYMQNGPGGLLGAGLNLPEIGRLRGNPVRIRDRPAAVSGDESRNMDIR